jgi:hypothetical protein
MPQPSIVYSFHPSSKNSEPETRYPVSGTGTG